MKKLALPYLLLLLPVLAFPQNKLPMLKDAWKKVYGISSAFKVNDHLGIMQVTLSDTSFALMALDNKMSVLWRDTLKGRGMACGNFKGSILAIADSGYSERKGVINPYYAFLIDPASGKVILQNTIFQQKAKHQEEAAALFTNDGSDFRLIVRQADISLSPLSPYKNKTEDLTLISLDEKLQSAFQNIKVPDEDFVGMTINNSGDIFLLTLRDRMKLQARRYEYGSTEPSEPLTLVCDTINKTDLFRAANSLVPSRTDRNVLYLSVAHTNPDEDREILTGKFNFTLRQVQTTSEVFTHKHKNEVEKSYVKVNEEFPAADLGAEKKEMTVQYVATSGDKLISISAEAFSITTYNVSSYHGYSLVINCYDSDLKRLYQQIMPVRYSRGFPQTTGYRLDAGELKIVSNTDYQSAYGQLDIATGKWLKLAWIDTDAPSSDRHIIWFNDTFIVSYIRPRAFGDKCDIDLVLAGY